MPSTCKVVYSTFPSFDKAQEISRNALSEGLIKCANILSKVQSIYEWEGKIQNNTEYSVLFKTTEDKIISFEQWLSKNHPYDVPVILIFSAETTQEFFKYLHSK